MLETRPRLGFERVSSFEAGGLEAPYQVEDDNGGNARYYKAADSR